MYIVFFEVLLMNKNVDYVALGKRIKEKRIQSHLTQEQLGEMCDLSTAHIGHIERGYENIVEKLRGLGADIKKVERMPAALDQAL